jgi:hypothetical protein
MKIVVFLTFVLSSISGAAQIETSVEVKGMVNYALPLGELGQVYKKAPNYQMGFAKSKMYKKKQSSVGISIGYLSMDSKYDTLIYEIITNNGVEYGKIHYKTYRSFQLLYNSQYDLSVSKFVALFYGYDAGFHFNIYGHYLKDPFFNEESEDRIMRWVLSPKAGLKFSITRQVALTIQSQYLAALGNASDPKMVFNHFFSVGTGLSVKLK